jgi:hypothetical protein
MTSTKGLTSLLALLAGLALALTVAGPGSGQPPRGRGTVTAYDNQGQRWHVVRDGDRFVVALRARKSDGIPPRNFNMGGDGVWLQVDGRDLGYDLSGESKDVLVPVVPDERAVGPQEVRRAMQALRWECVPGRKGSPFRGYFRAKNGALKGWWIGLGPPEPAKKDGRARARLVLVQDQKDALGFSWTNPEDEWSP